MSELDATEENYTCPFCMSPIDQDLSLYGGTCSRCFGEVPGEEAITDPGDMPTETGLKIYEVKSRVWQVIPILIALILMIVMGGWGLWLGVVRPAQVADRIDFDEETDFDFMADMAKLSMDAPLPVQPVAPPVRSGPKTPNTVVAPRPSRVSKSEGLPSSALLSGGGAASVTGGSSMSGLTLNSEASGGEELGSRKSASGGPKLPTNTGPDLLLTRTSGPSTPLGLGVEIKAEREKPIITDSDEIKEHIYNVMRKSLSTVTNCYKARLKSNRSLRGKWRISFVVTRSGHATQAEARGLSTQDPELETCIAAEIEKWSFFRLPSDQPVSKSLTFSP